LPAFNFLISLFDALWSGREIFTFPDMLYEMLFGRSADHLRQIENESERLCQLHEEMTEKAKRWLPIHMPQSFKVMNGIFADSKFTDGINSLQPTVSAQ
jgi:hypothetical protein